MTELELAWQAALRKHIPGVIVREDHSIPEDDPLPFLTIYMIPDDRMQDYIRVVLGERFAFMARENLADAHLLPCTVSQTRACCPSIWAEAQNEVRRSGPAKNAGTSAASERLSRKKSPVKKTARRAQTVAH